MHILLLIIIKCTINWDCILSYLKLGLIGPEIFYARHSISEMLIAQAYLVYALVFTQIKVELTNEY